MPLSLIIALGFTLFTIVGEYYLFKSRKKKEAYSAAFVTFFAAFGGYVSNQFVEVSVYPSAESLVILNKATSNMNDVMTELEISADFRANRVIASPRIEDIHKLDKFFNTLGYFDVNSPNETMLKKLQKKGFINTNSLTTECFFQEETRIDAAVIINTSDCLPFNIYFEKVFKGLHQIHLTNKSEGSVIQGIQRLQIPHKGANFVTYNHELYIISIPRADHVSSPEKQFASIVVHKIKDKI